MAIRDSSRRSVPRATTLGGIAIVLMALALRWWQLRDSLWLDELHTAWCVAGSWADVSPRAAIGNQSPLYFYGLRLIVAVCGLSELSLRIPSLIAGLGMIGVAGYATKRWTHSIAAALFVILLVAIDRNFIFYSQEARPYAILQLVAWCHAFVVWRMIEQPTLGNRLLFVLGAVLQFYLHYTSVLFLIAEFAFLLDTILDQRGTGSYRWKQLAIDAGLILAATLPAIGHLRQIHARRELWELFVKQLPTIHDFSRTLRFDIYLLPAIAFLLGWYLLRLRSDSELESDKQSLRRSLSLLASLLLIPSVLAWLATRRQWASLFFTRYLVSSLVAAPIASGVLSWLLPSTRWRVVAACVTITASIWYSNMWQQWQLDGRILGDRRQDWRGAVAFINQHASPSKSVCYVRGGFVEAQQLRSAHSTLLEEYCLAPVNSIYQLKMNAIPIDSPRDIQIKPEWLSPDAEETWFLINSRPETRQQFLQQVEQQCRLRGLEVPFVQQELFGDVLACQLNRVEGQN